MLYVVIVPLVFALVKVSHRIFSEGLGWCAPRYDNWHTTIRTSWLPHTYQHEEGSWNRVHNSSLMDQHDEIAAMLGYQKSHTECTCRQEAQ